MSEPATRAVMAARRSGAIGGGSTLLVGLAMAEGATVRSGELTAGLRDLGGVCELSAATVSRAVRVLVAAGVVDVADDNAGRHARTYRFVLPTRNAKLGDNGPPVLHGRNTSEDVAFHGRNTSGGLALHGRNANVPRVRDESARAPAVDTPTHPVGGVCGGGGVGETQTAAEPRQPDQGVSAGAAARARYEAELTPAAELPARVAELRGAMDAEPPPRPEVPPEDRPEDVTAPEDMAGRMAYVRERGGYVRGRGE